jgi:hypothetical protein
MAPCPILPDGELLPPFTVAKLENLGRLGAQVPKAGLESTLKRTFNNMQISG